VQIPAEHLAALSPLLEKGLDLPDHAREQWLKGLAEPFPGAKTMLRKMLGKVASGEAADLLDTLLKVPLPEDEPAPGAHAATFNMNDKIGNYRLERLLGRGGMGSVWLARRTDELVNRPVALKLPHLHLQSAYFAERFARERDILANLTHPNIAHLYDAGISAQGQPYLAMEYVAGKSITQYCESHGSTIVQRIELFLQVLSAVHYAHTQNVIHRDLKPSNILVREGAQVVLLDFGIAKLLVEGETNETALTRHGGAALTPDYASPEQISGETLGAATDIYSLGVVLYQLLSGRRPYELKQSTRRALEEAILTSDPRPPSEVATSQTTANEATRASHWVRRALQGDLDTIVLKALKKQPEERYLTASDFAEDLRRHLKGEAVSARPDSLGYRTKKWALRNKPALQSVAITLAVIAALLLGTSALWRRSDGNIASAPAGVTTPSAVPIAPPQHSVAVLPFVDMSEKKDQEYFSDGLAQELIEHLGRTPGLKVIARTSSFAFKGKSDEITTIAAKLRVANVLEGSVRRSGDHLRVTTELISADSGQSLWSETFDREFKDVFAIQDEIASAVVSALKLKLSGGPVAAAAPHGTTNPEAFNAYLQGRQFFLQANTVAEFRQATEAYQKAINLDPRYADAYADLAMSEYRVADQTGDHAIEKQAAQAADKAVDLDPGLAYGYAIRGFLRAQQHYDWAGAESDFKHALALEPTNSRVLQHYAILLMYVGRTNEAVAMLRNAVELDPLSSSYWQQLGRTLEASREYPAAYDAFHHAQTITPRDRFTNWNLGRLQLIDGQAQEALATFQSNPDEIFRNTGVALAEHTLGDTKASQQALDSLIAAAAGEAAYQIAEVYAWRGEKDKAFEWLERAHRQQDGGLVSTKADLLLASLRSDPRYLAMLRKLNFPP